MLPCPTLDGITAVDMPPYFGGAELHTDPIEHSRRADTSVAEADRPDALILLRLTREATDGNIRSAYVAEAGDRPILFGAYNPEKVDRSVALYVIGLRHGVPRKVAEIDFDAIHTEEQAAAAAVEALQSLGGAL